MLSRNPTRGAIRARIDLPRAGRLEVDLYDIRGRRVAQLYDAEARSGTLVAFDGPGHRPAFEAGVYFLAARVAGAKATQRIVVLR